MVKTVWVWTGTTTLVGGGETVETGVEEGVTVVLETTVLEDGVTMELDDGVDWGSVEDGVEEGVVEEGVVEETAALGVTVLKAVVVVTPSEVKVLLGTVTTPGMDDMAETCDEDMGTAVWRLI